MLKALYLVFCYDTASQLVVIAEKLCRSYTVFKDSNANFLKDILKSGSTWPLRCKTR